MSSSATFGTDVMADGILGQPVQEIPITDNPNSNIFPRTQTGFFTLGQRVYSRPESVKLTPVDAGDADNPSITITTVSGAFIGKIRTDIQFSILESLRFTNIDGINCADFQMKLNKLPDFPIPRFAMISFSLNGRINNAKWYKGLIEDIPEPGTQRKTFDFKGNGFRQYATMLSGNFEVIAGKGKDVGLAFLELCESILVPQTPINLNYAKINTTTGVILVNKLNFAKYKLDKIFDTLASMAQHSWGVDGDGDVYFIPAPKPTDKPVKTLFVGYDIQNFKPKFNIKDVRNTIVVQRKQGAGAGGAGWVVGGIYSDTSSIAKYKKREYNFQVPGFFEQEEIELIGKSILNEKKEPKFSGSADGYKIKNGFDFLEFGLYRFINKFNDYPIIFSDVDDASFWIKTGAGDLTTTNENNIMVIGSNSVKLSYVNGLNDELIYSNGSFKGSINKIRIFVRSTKIGQLITLGVGKTTAFEQFVKIDFPIQNIFYNFEWDVSGLPITEINKIGIRIDDIDILTPTNIYIDKIEFQITGHKYYKMPLTKSTYMFSSNKVSARIEFGTLPPKMENFLKNLFSTASELKYTQEIEK